jgi:hypothetical protein
MRFTIISLVFLWGCESDLPRLPIRNPTTVEEARQMAAEIAGQDCEFTGVTSPGADVAIYTIECNRSVYTLEVTQAHLYESDWRTKGAVWFEYRSELQLKPVYADNRGVIERVSINSAYYLKPHGN